MAWTLPAAAKLPPSGMTLVIVGLAGAEVAWAMAGPAAIKLVAARVDATAATAMAGRIVSLRM